MKLGPPKPWSKLHKKVCKSVRFSFSDSYAQPLRNAELIEMTKARGDNDLVDQFYDHSLAYTANGGSHDLRHEVSKLYGDKISADNILIFTGAQVALQTAANALVTEGSHCIVFTPCYQSVQDCPLQAGFSVTKIRLHSENDFKMCIDDVRAAIRPNTRYIVINQPYNPTGYLMSRAQQQELVQLADKHNIYVLSDEVYRFLEHDPNDRLPAMADAMPRGMSVMTMSKPWGACGVSIGWIATQDMDLKQKLVDTQYFGTACPSRASEIQAMMVLRSSDTILAKNMKILLRNKALLKRFVNDFSDFFDWVEPTAGAIAWVKFKGPLTSEQLGDQLAGAGIGMKPAYCFADDLLSAGDTEYQNWFRMGYGVAKTTERLAALERFVVLKKSDWAAQMKKNQEDQSRSRSRRLTLRLLSMATLTLVWMITR